MITKRVGMGGYRFVIIQKSQEVVFEKELGG